MEWANEMVNPEGLARERKAGGLVVIVRHNGFY
jgi:hypothetical protein